MSSFESDQHIRMEKTTDPAPQELPSDGPDEAGTLSQPETKTWKVVCLTIALCLGIFCMSLVSKMLGLTRTRLTVGRM